MGEFTKGTGDRTIAQLPAPPQEDRKGNMNSTPVKNEQPRQVTVKGK